MQPAFLSQTALAPDQERTNFTLFDNPVIDLLTSSEADKVCSKMFLIYTRLRRADWQYFERAGVLLLHGDGDRTAWEILCEIAGVASATLAKAIRWMKEQRVIGYWAGKNNAGIRIFFNVARGSLRPKNAQKNLRLVPTSFVSSATSANEAPFKESFAFQENNQDLEERAARETQARAELPLELPASNDEQSAPIAPTKPTLQLVPPVAAEPRIELRLALLDALVRKVEALERAIQDVARSIPNQAWLENALVPKAIRVALAEVFRQQHGRALSSAKSTANVGRSQPVISEEALSEYDALRQAEDRAEAALRALSPEAYTARIAALEQQAATDPRYAKIRWADDEAKRVHFEAMLKRELLNNHSSNERNQWSK